MTRCQLPNRLERPVGSVHAKYLHFPIRGMDDGDPRQKGTAQPGPRRPCPIGCFSPAMPKLSGIVQFEHLQMAVGVLAHDRACPPGIIPRVNGARRQQTQNQNRQRYPESWKGPTISVQTAAHLSLGYPMTYNCQEDNLAQASAVISTKSFQRFNFSSRFRPIKAKNIHRSSRLPGFPDLHILFGLFKVPGHDRGIRNTSDRPKPNRHG